jgi:hypothetical protein
MQITCEIAAKKNATTRRFQRFFPFTVKTVHNLKISEPHVVTVTGKAFMILLMRLQIIQTDDIRRKITLCGKFTR